MMISGDWFSGSVGHSAEVYLPFIPGRHCQLPNLPDWRRRHSQDAKTVCGGSDSDTRTSCLTLTDDGWQRTTTLLEER